MNEPIIYKVSSTDAGLRLDACLAGKLLGHSRAQITKFIKLGAILVNGRPSKPSMSLLGSERISFTMPCAKKATLEKEALPLDIIYSDDAIAVINKPSGLVVHPGAGVHKGTLCNALLYHFPDMAIGNEERPGIVHRLDKDTSGVMVVAKTHEAHQFLSAEFKERRVAKIYKAWCFGDLRPARIELKTGHVRHPHNALKFFTGIAEPQILGKGVRMAHTSVAVVHRRDGLCAIEATLHTGRTHQIRAHLADIGHPLLGDSLYGGARATPRGMDPELLVAIAGLKGQALHAASLSFRHPVTKEPLFFNAPLPSHLEKLDALFTPT
jgi:23S rRNA pseudouridine1911/1915/1917 synthase